MHAHSKVRPFFFFFFLGLWYWNGGLFCPQEPLPLVLATPGFRSETGRFTKPTLKNTLKHRMSYSFSASASVAKPESETPTDFQMSYSDYRLDHVDYDAGYYRQFFFGQGFFLFFFSFTPSPPSFIWKWFPKNSSSLEHRNYIGIDEKFGPIAISVRRERAPTRSAHEQEEWRYRGIFRTKEGCDLRTVFPEASVITSSRVMLSLCFSLVVND